jgi:glyoxylase-like metal-dependent hydrolase (beta-lactamase superfamily II)
MAASGTQVQDGATAAGASATYEVFAVRYATRDGRRREAFYRYETYGEPDSALAMDYFFWVLRGEDRTIVVDTGFNVEVGARMGRTVLCPPVEALARMGVDPGSVAQVVLTHLHYDHTGNLDLFPEAELVVAERELSFWTGPIARREHFAHHARPEDVARVADAHAHDRVKLVDREREVAPGVRVLRVGGHSPGQLVVVVATEGGDAVLASDSLHYYEELEQDRPFAVFSDLAEVYGAFDTLRELTAGDDELLVAGHDPIVTTRFAAAEGDAAGVALRIARPNRGA